MTIPPIRSGPATTNLLANPSAETDLTNIAANGSVTLSRVAHAPMTAGAGDWAVQSVCAGAASLEGVSYTTTAGLGWTGTARPVVGSIWAEGAGTVYVWVRALYTDASGVNGTLQSVALTGTPQRLVAPVYTTDPAKTLNFLLLYVRTNGAQAVTFRTDAAQVEEGTAPTPFTVGTRRAGLPGFLTIGQTHIGPLRVGRS